MKQLTLVLLIAALGTVPATAGEAADEESDRAAVETAVMNYLRGYEKADGDLLHRAFFARHAHIKGLSRNEDGDWVVGSSEMGPVLERWSSREPREPLTGEILSLDIVRGQAAQVVFDFDGRYVDLLHLLKVDGEWRIVNKIYLPVPEAED